MGRLFGTDGVRGIANTELTCETAMEIGRAAAVVLTDGMHRKPKFIIGKDTRSSCDMLEGALQSGLCSVGANVTLLGVVPTPAVAYLVKKYKADAGIMISASHNPCEYNGIKIFSSDGHKLPDALEEQIEAIVLDRKISVPAPVGDGIGRVSVASFAADDYIKHIVKTVDISLDGLKIGIDCAYGSASVTAKKLFSELGAECLIMYDTPNGVNINENCGSTHLENLADFVVRNSLDCGIAFDGDADRCLAIDDEGNVFDGDYIMAILADDLNKRGKLKNSTVVGTIMTNMGFIKFCESLGLRFVATKVGDRYVLEEMLLEGYNFGGEQSGHIIFLDHCTTGDGQLTAVQLLALMKREGIKLSEFAARIKKYPQKLVNINVSPEGKIRFYTDQNVKEAIEEAKEELGESGRVVVRVSGTEPLIRVMTEGPCEEQIDKIANNIAAVVKAYLC
ncbi:MAG: phosphoglucosamine mutase [Oscillospiraceae bacterium]|nr:phosphoglucosamine mutase [Oscillospiraceae bacterium]